MVTLVSPWLHPLLPLEAAAQEMPHSAGSASRQRKKKQYHEAKDAFRKARKMADGSSTAASDYSFTSLSTPAADEEDGPRFQLSQFAEGEFHTGSQANGVGATGSSLHQDQGEAELPIVDEPPRLVELDVPTITEDELLAFQFKHFGDDTRPDTFFVGAHAACSYQPWLEELGDVDEDDGLGWYQDGVKRTLTEAQIALFRHSEFQRILRETQLRREEEEANQPEEAEASSKQATTEQSPPSPAQSESSIEDDLLGLARNLKPPAPRRRPSSQAPSDNSRSTGSMRRARKQEVPYEQRYKRKWEQYIEKEDEQHGSLTQNRILRELDDLAEEKIDMDY